MSNTYIILAVIAIVILVVTAIIIRKLILVSRNKKELAEMERYQSFQGELIIKGSEDKVFIKTNKSKIELNNILSKIDNSMNGKVVQVSGKVNVSESVKAKSKDFSVSNIDVEEIEFGEEMIISGTYYNGVLIVFGGYYNLYHSVENYMNGKKYKISGILFNKDTDAEVFYEKRLVSMEVA